MEKNPNLQKPADTISESSDQFQIPKKNHPSDLSSDKVVSSNWNESKEYRSNQTPTADSLQSRR